MSFGGPHVHSRPTLPGSPIDLRYCSDMDDFDPFDDSLPVRDESRATPGVHDPPIREASRAAHAAHDPPMREVSRAARAAHDPHMREAPRATHGARGAHDARTISRRREPAFGLGLLGGERLGGARVARLG